MNQYILYRILTSIVLVDGLTSTPDVSPFIKWLSNFFPILLSGAFLAAIIGFVGIVYKGKIDRGIAEKTNSSKVIDNVFKENDSFRNKISQQEEQLQTYRSKEMDLKKVIIDREAEIKLLTQRYEERVKDVEKAQQTLIVITEKLDIAIKEGERFRDKEIRDELTKLGVSEAVIEKITKKGVE